MCCERTCLKCSVELIPEYDQSGEYEQEVHQQGHAVAPEIVHDAEQRIYEKEAGRTEYHGFLLSDILRYILRNQS